mmetsp:Transcript_19434/g.29420  ORF Transcript_19434/g.29420 Transcript_19434/m.29420 type:complete len:522 (-) Transcript_19434:120-1685(-)|eukprot:CAMPEP_0194122944 /NCGR_PEP_ID=MMETSP0150-20130528/52551_1 /TAXON_ID=122233 /ORGANISM="Chaetoceros debilis, Strain MM31A-1" /LENGTH=521 /DNA_ID=CAMNT_0038816001 /DNA_START=159 /DNA_END=1724 /DNA_ORIENTATION=+
MSVHRTFIKNTPFLRRLAEPHQRIHVASYRTIEVIDPRASSQKNEEGDKKKKKVSKYRKEGGAASYKFVDRARIKVSGGKGGKGCVSYQAQLMSSYKKRPDGGHGGNGGNVVIIADKAEQSLNMQSHHFKGENGKNGSSKQMHGRNGNDKIIRVPCGVIVKRILDFNETWDEEEQRVRMVNAKDDSMYEDDQEGSLEGSVEGESNSNRKSTKPDDFDEVVNQEIKSDDGYYYWNSENKSNDDDELVTSSDLIYDVERETVDIADLNKSGSYIVVGDGGRGGKGNSLVAKRQFHQRHLTHASERALGELGEMVHLQLELKLIADIGLVGFPNAGKSSLLAAMSKAQPAIAPYPFTTLHPLIGTLKYNDGFRALVADVPGLIGGAADGRGRGHDFLRHLERTKALLYIVDSAGVDGRNPLTDMEILVDEIESYGDGDMLERPVLVVANKLDLIKDADAQDEILYAISQAATSKGLKFDGKVHGISAGVTGEGLGDLSLAMRNLVESGEIKRSERNQASSFGYL